MNIVLKFVVTDEDGNKIHTDEFDTSKPGEDERAGQQLDRLLEHYPPEFGWTLTITITGVAVPA